MGGIAKSCNYTVILGAFFMAASLTGCSGVPEIEVESPLLGKLGLIGGKKKNETKLVERGPLVPPPTKTLPVPGSGQTVANTSDWPVDPADREKEIAALKDKKQKEYEEKGDWSANRDPEEFDKLSDPLSRRKRGLFGDISIDAGESQSK